MIIADGPGIDDADAIAYRNDWGSDRVFIVDPWVTRYDPISDGLVDMPASAHVAGLLAKSDDERGFWWSPSNNTLNGISGTSRAVDFVLGDPQSRANLLNEQRITTIINQDGYRLWGNRSAATDPNFSFLSVRRTFDLVLDSIMRAHLWAIARNLSKSYVNEVQEGVNSYIRDLVTRGALIAGSCTIDPELNTPDQTALGRVYFDLDLTPPVPAEHIIFRARLVNDNLTEIFN